MTQEIHVQKRSYKNELIILLKFLPIIGNIDTKKRNIEIVAVIV
jgi:hypothetical protein